MRESAADRFCPLVRIRGSGTVWVRCLVWPGLFVTSWSSPGLCFISQHLVLVIQAGLIAVLIFGLDTELVLWLTSNNRGSSMTTMERCNIMYIMYHSLLYKPYHTFCIITYPFAVSVSHFTCLFFQIQIQKGFIGMLQSIKIQFVQIFGPYSIRVIWTLIQH